MGSENRQVADDVKYPVFDCHPMTGMGGAGLGLVLGHFVHRHLPSALWLFRVGGVQAGAGNVHIEDGLAIGFVLVMKETQSPTEGT